MFFGWFKKNISAPAKQDFRANGRKYNWQANLSQVTVDTVTGNPQNIIPKLREGELVDLVLKHDTIVVYAKKRQIGVLQYSYHFDELLKKIRNNEIIDAEIEKTGTVSGAEHIWWCSIRITLYKNDEDVTQEQLKRVEKQATRKGILSNEMTGESDDYIKAIDTILISAGKDVSKAKYFKGSQFLTVTWNGISWASIAEFKLQGRLQYWLAEIDLEKCKGIVGERYVCEKASKSEGENKTRIFIHNPEDISLLSGILVQQYDKAEAKTAYLMR